MPETKYYLIVVYGVMMVAVETATWLSMAGFMVNVYLCLNTLDVVGNNFTTTIHIHEGQMYVK